MGACRVYSQFFWLHTLRLSRLWASLGRRRRSFSPPVLAFIYNRALVSAIPWHRIKGSGVRTQHSEEIRPAIPYILTSDGRGKAQNIDTTIVRSIQSWGSLAQKRRNAIHTCFSITLFLYLLIKATQGGPKNVTQHTTLPPPPPPLPPLPQPPGQKKRFVFSSLAFLGILVVTLSPLWYVNSVWRQWLALYSMRFAMRCRCGTEVSVKITCEKK